MWMLIALGLLVVLAALVLVAAVRPPAFTIERSQEMACPPARAFAFVNSFRAWSGWSPWEQVDPQMQRTYGGAEAGVGATYAWSGNKKAGQGSMTITASEPGQRIAIALVFTAPWKATNTTEFRFSVAPNGGAIVRWQMTGENPFFFRLMGLFFNMDKLVGKDFEKGLAAMKQLAEAPAA